MKITKSCDIDGDMVTMDIPLLTPELFDVCEKKRENTGALIQNVYHFLTPAEREFIRTGITPEKWEQIFGNE